MLRDFHQGGFSMGDQLATGPIPGSRRKGRSRDIMMIVVLAVFLTLLIVTVAVAFSDTPAGDPYTQAIQTLSDRGIIGGFPDGTFRPDNPVIRQQFAKMIVLTLALQISESNVVPFDDVQIDGFADPFYPDNYIAVAAENGITNGTGPRTFSPGANILRAQVVTMIVRAVQNVLPAGTLVTPPSSYTGTLPNFSDIHSPNMRLAEYNGLLGGLQGFGPSWDPFKAASRAEVAQMLANLLTFMSNPGSTTTSGSTSTTGASSTTTSSSSSTSTTDDSSNRVRIIGTTFSPGTLTVAVGTTVTWRNDSDLTHRVAADGGSFASPNLPPDATFSHTFNIAGVFAYHCSIHTFMHGTITVQ